MSRSHWRARQEATGFSVAGASTSHRSLPPGRRRLAIRRELCPDPEHLVLVSEVRAIWEASDGTDGSPRVTHEL